MYLGIDIGSTTIKTVLCDRNGDILYSDYRRHNTDITATAAAGTAPEEAHGTSCPTGTDGADMEQERLITRRFETSDRGRTIVVPYFAEGYSEFIPSVLKVMGYDAISLPPGTQNDVETGLRCANNDICYPATIVVGSVINFLKSGKLPRAEGTHRTGSGGIRRSHPHRTASQNHRNRRRNICQIQFVQQQGRGPLAQPPWHRDGSPLRLQLLHLRLCQPPHQ